VLDAALSETKMRPVRLLVASTVFGSWAFSTMAAPLSPEDAGGHIGEIVTVCGVVASTKYEADAQSQQTLLDFGKPYPNAVFTAVGMGRTARNSGPPRLHSAASASVRRGQSAITGGSRRSC
jgi:hypothetical protein